MPQQKKQEHPLNPGEAKTLKVTIERLNQTAAKQALYGIVNVLSTKATLHVKLFGEILDDAWLDSLLTNQKGASAVEYAILMVGIAAACIVGVGLLGEKVKQIFEAAANLFATF
jgi:Flp pilus assembly pilin Flp